MQAFGSPTVVNPFDRFGDHVRLALHAPAAYQLSNWLVSGPGAELPTPGRAPTDGRWVLCGYGRFGHKLADDLRADGLEVIAIDRDPDPEAPIPVIKGDASEPEVMEQARLTDAAGFVAGTDNDTTNLSLIAAARRINPDLFVAARQNRPTSATLFAAMRPDWELVPAEVVAKEIYAQLATPLLWRFLQELPARGDEWAARMIDQLRDYCGTQLGDLWKMTLTRRETPALVAWLDSGDARIGDLLRNPQDRDRRLSAVAMLVLRNGEAILGPEPDVTLKMDDQILLAGDPAARRALHKTTFDHGASEYVLHGRSVPSGWLWQRVTGRVPGSR
jgi:voltage-gated potassium channel